MLVAVSHERPVSGDEITSSSDSFGSEADLFDSVRHRQHRPISRQPTCLQKSFGDLISTPTFARFFQITSALIFFFDATCWTVLVSNEA